jgi:periplasmic protein TonB
MVPPAPEPVPPAEPTEIAPPVPEPSPPPPAVQEAMTPPQIVEQEPVEPPQKRQVLKNPARVEPPTRSRRREGPTTPPSTSDTGGQESPRPGPPIPAPDEDPTRLGGNVLGPSPLSKAENLPQLPREGGQAGAGHLFEKGDASVVPGAGMEGGSGALGRSGLGWDAEGRGAKAGGMRPGASGEGLGEGTGGSTGPRGGYQVKPRYPDAARRRGLEGTVLLRARVTAQGRVDDVHVENSAGHPELDQAAIEALRRWRFEPARRGREPVAAWVVVPFQFKLQ